MWAKGEHLPDVLAGENEALAVVGGVLSSIASGGASGAGLHPELNILLPQTTSDVLKAAVACVHASAHGV